ncbi:MAG: ABC transporter permease [Alphaproteobacteria bacterium]|nr:ABC transporter permease [Alphaproteobacteria bacterium]
MLFLRKIEKFLRRQGVPLVSFTFKVGELFVFIAQSIYNCFTPPFYGRNLWRQIMDIGFYSLPVVGLTTIFAGMVIALQSYSGFASVGAESMVASVVLISVTRELAPVLSALMVAGRIGAAMAAEIGTMRVTEQIDALTTLSTNPFKYLVAPRIWAGLIVMPLLVLIGDVIGIFGGYVVGVYKLGFNASNYINATLDDLEALDITTGIVKAAVFGFIIALMGCYNGYKSKGGAQGVGTATTNAVVSSSILILIFNYIVTELFFSR